MHQLEILGKHLVVTRLHFDRAFYMSKNKTRTNCWWFTKIDVKKKGGGYYHQKFKGREVPSGLHVFTLEELVFIINDIQRNYLRPTHSYSFRGERYFIRLYDLEEIIPEEVSTDTFGGDR